MSTLPALDEDVTYRKFGEYYDAIYSDRDYRKDVGLVLHLIEEFAGPRACRVLELGCGTGGHSIPLAQAGYQVLGVDQSPEMLAAARRKAAAAPGLHLELRRMDIRTLSFVEEFDACVSMFGCMSYLTTIDDLRRTLQGVERSMLPQGVFIFDFWNEAAVKKLRPTVRRKDVVLAPGRNLVRIASPEVDWREKICSICYQVRVFEDQTLQETFEETHRVRFFSHKEMTEELDKAGLEILAIRRPDGTRTEMEADESWFLVAIARRKRESRGVK